MAGRGRIARVLREISRNRALARLLLAYGLIIVAEFGEWLALLIYAYERGGASEAGLAAILQLLPSMLLGPMINARLARMGPARALTLAYLAAAVSLAVCGAAILAGASIVLVLGTAMVFSLALGVGRPLHPVLMPLVVQHPDELTAANAATSWCEGVGTLAGPALAGALVTADGPGLACAVLAGLLVATPVLSNVTLLRAAESEGEEETGALSDVLAAARIIAARPSTRALVAFPAGSALIESAIDLLVVVLAVRVLAIGSGAAGYLGAAFGAGSLLGGLAGILLVGRRLAAPLTAAALVGALALGALAFASTVLGCVVLLAVVGAARSLQAIAAQTLLQRSTPLDVVVCAFSLIESLRDAGMMLSALLVPALIGLGGVKAAFVGLALFSPLLVLLTARRLRRVDAEASIPVVEIGVLRELPVFGALPAASVETLAREARYASYPTGAAIIEEGDEGDAYHVITHGSGIVTKDEHEVRRLGVGDGFGEIALLHAVTRTATVRATSDTTVLSVGRDPFLAAMHAQPASRATAERVARELLAHSS